jgi:hypothetical protein
MGSVLQDLPVAEWFLYYNANHRRKVGKIFSFFCRPQCPSTNISLFFLKPSTPPDIPQLKAERYSTFTDIPQQNADG